MAETASRVGSVVGLAAHLGRGLQRVATDVVVGRARSLPRTIGKLDARFLSQLMGATVTSVSVIGGDAGTSSRARLALTGEGVPDSVFVKMPAETAATRVMGELGRLAETETRFYRELSPQLSGSAEVVRLGIRSAHRPLRVGARRPCGGPLRVPRHASSAQRGSGQSGGRTAGPPARDLLGARALLGLHGVGRHRGAPDGPAVEDVGAPDRREDRTSASNVAGSSTTTTARWPGSSTSRRTPSCTAMPIRETSTSATARRACWTGRRCDAATPAGSWPTPLSRAWTPTTGGTSQRELLDHYRQALAAAGGPEMDGDDLWRPLPGGRAVRLRRRR